MMNSFFFFLLLMNIFMFIKFKNYMLMILISLEFMIVTLYLNIYIYMNNLNLEWILIYFILISVCESVIGLTMIVKMVNFYGNQNLNNLNLLWY